MRNKRGDVVQFLLLMRIVRSALRISFSVVRERGGSHSIGDDAVRQFLNLWYFRMGKAVLRFCVLEERRSNFLNCRIVWLVIGNLAHPEILVSSTVGSVLTSIWNEVRKLWGW
jgi:hypothetical protein